MKTETKEAKKPEGHAPGVSVVITAYNVADYIEQCVASALGQTLAEPEAIVVLDKPTDGTDAKVKAMAELYGGRLRVVENSENLGAGLSRRRGVEAARGEYVLLLDGDDWIERGFVKSLLDCARKTGADIVSGGVTVREPSGYYEVQCCGDCVTEGYDKIVKYWGLKTVFMNNRLIRRSLFDKVPYCGRRYIEDTPTIIPMLWYANRVAYVDNPGYNYRVNPKSLTHSADRAKEFVYKGLCWCDLVEFFNAHDPGLYGRLDIRQYAGEMLRQLNGRGFTAAELQPYAGEWAELWMRFFNLIGITGIDYKRIIKQ